MIAIDNIAKDTINDAILHSSGLKIAPSHLGTQIRWGRSYNDIPEIHFWVRQIAEKLIILVV
jgi:hypothetical protein